MEHENKNVGPIVGTLVVVIVLVAAALYVLASHINRQARLSTNTASSTVIIHMNNGADDVQTLQNDLNNSMK